MKGWRGLIACAALLVCAVAEACPACTGREGGGTMRTVLVGAMVSLPFILVGLALVGIRSLNRRDAGEAPGAADRVGVLGVGGLEVGGADDASSAGNGTGGER